MITTLRQDASSYMRGWGRTSSKPGWVLWMRLLLLTPGFQFVFWLRVQHAVAGVPVIGTMLRRIVWYWTTIIFGCDIDPQTKIGPGLYIPHPTGIVIGGRVVIGNDVSVMQNVTLGRNHHGSEANPIIGDGVEIGTGAAVLGGITIGAKAKIGANSVVLKDVPAGALAVGSPARVIATDKPTEEIAV